MLSCLTRSGNNGGGKIESGGSAQGGNGGSGSATAGNGGSGPSSGTGGAGGTSTGGTVTGGNGGGASGYSQGGEHESLIFEHNSFSKGNAGSNSQIVAPACYGSCVYEAPLAAPQTSMGGASTGGNGGYGGSGSASSQGGYAGGGASTVRIELRSFMVTAANNFRLLGAVVLEGQTLVPVEVQLYSCQLIQY